MSQFNDPSGQTPRRIARSRANGRSSERVGVDRSLETPGLAVTPPVTTTRAGEFITALRIADTGLRRASRSLDKNTAAAERADASDAKKIVDSRVPDLLERMERGELEIEPEGVEGMLGNIFSDITDNHVRERAIDASRGILNSAAARAKSNRIADDKIEQEVDAVDALLTDPTIDISDFDPPVQRRIRSEAANDRMAARDRDGFDALVADLPDFMANDLRVQFDTQDRDDADKAEHEATEAMRAGVAEALIEGDLGKAEAILRESGNVPADERLPFHNTVQRTMQTRLDDWQKMVGLYHEAKLDREKAMLVEETDNQESAVEDLIGMLGSSGKGFGEIGPMLVEIKRRHPLAEMDPLAVYNGLVSQRLERFGAEGNPAGVASLKHLIDPKDDAMGETFADELHTANSRFNAKHADAIRKADEQRDELALFDITTMAGKEAATAFNGDTSTNFYSMPEEIDYVLPSGKAGTLSRDEFMAEGYAQELEARFGEGRSPIVEWLNGNDVKSEEIEEHLNMLLASSGYRDPAISRMLNSAVAGIRVNDNAIEIPEEAERALEAYRILRGNSGAVNLAALHAETFADDTFDLADRGIKHMGWSNERAFAKAVGRANSSRDANGNLIPIVVDRKLAEAQVKKFDSKWKKDPLLAPLVEAIAKTYKQFMEVDDETALEVAAERIKQDYQLINGYLFYKADTPFAPTTIQRAGEWAIDKYVGASGHITHKNVSFARDESTGTFFIAQAGTRMPIDNTPRFSPQDMGTIAAFVKEADDIRRLRASSKATKDSETPGVGHMSASRRFAVFMQPGTLERHMKEDILEDEMARDSIEYVPDVASFDAFLSDKPDLPSDEMRDMILRVREHALADLDPPPPARSHGSFLGGTSNPLRGR